MGLVGEVGFTVEASECCDSLAEAEGPLVLLNQGTLCVLQLGLARLQAAQQPCLLTLHL